jgi:hypothetical protein
MAFNGPYNVAAGTPGHQILIDDTQAKLAELLEQDVLHDTALSEFLAVLLSTETSREGLEAQLSELLEDLTPRLLGWCAGAAVHMAGGASHAARGIGRPSGARGGRRWPAALGIGAHAIIAGPGQPA